ncbi:cytochrome c family protein [Rhizobium sp. FKY42]|uniref:c-type cytochrome n=1 Tax=Rhizobium sp. FKY42 TaxID=2562310 RepID=UPI0010C0A28B|nr:cytochrome c family protein [Rhizobium sp. FKY42]
MRSLFDVLFTSIFSVVVLSTGSARAADVRAGERIFQKCASCHSLTSDSNGFGPSLKGVIGRPAGSLHGFRYSPAMVQAGAAGLTWDEAALSDFLRSPKDKVPGTSMRFWGFWFQSEIDDVVAYIKANQ